MPLINQSAKLATMLVSSLVNLSWQAPERAKERRDMAIELAGGSGEWILLLLSPILFAVPRVRHFASDMKGNA